MLPPSPLLRLRLHHHHCTVFMMGFKATVMRQSIFLGWWERTPAISLTLRSSLGSASGGREIRAKRTSEELLEGRLMKSSVLCPLNTHTLHHTVLPVSWLKKVWPDVFECQPELVVPHLPRYEWKIYCRKLYWRRKRAVSPSLNFIYRALEKPRAWPLKQATVARKASF